MSVLIRSVDLSLENVLRAIDVFNQIQVDCYLDPCVDVSEINTDNGIIFVPEINDPMLEKKFWDYINRYCVRNGFEYCIVIGNEVFHGLRQ